MGTLAQLLGVISGWDPDPPPEGVQMNPDPALQFARMALAGKKDRAEALKLLEKQINLLQPLLLLRDLDAIDETLSQNLRSKEVMHKLASELHMLAGLLSIQQAEWDLARSHLLAAVAAQPDNVNSRFHFVQFYQEIGKNIDALDLLETIFNLNPEFEGANYQLFHLSVDIERSGALADARRGYSRIIERDPEGIIGYLAAQKMRSHATPPPSQKDLTVLYRKADDSIGQGDPGKATKSYLKFISWEPSYPYAWYGMGTAWMMLASQSQSMIGQEGSFSFIPGRMTDEDYRSILWAQQSLELAVSLGPKLADAYNNLARCDLILGSLEQAAKASYQAVQLAPNRPDILAHSSRVFIQAGDWDTAFQLASAAHKIDPEQPEALSILNLINPLSSTHEGPADER